VKEGITTIEEAIATNVLGTRALVEKTLDAQARRGAPIHYVHISTAYVSGRRRGSIVEGPVEPRVDWRAETELGLRMPAYIEDASRMPAQLAEFRRLAERDHGRAGPLTAAVLADERRRDWVTKKLKDAGGERGRSLGWTDGYTFTKAMGEGVVEDLGAALRCSIVRPSIIESALVSPYPGWIEGFKMAEPLILAYGRGELPEFPAAADSIVDIVPADHVVNADPRGLRDDARTRQPRLLPRQFRGPEPADVQPRLRIDPRVLRRAPVSRRPSAGRSGCRTGSSRVPTRSNASSPPASARTRSRTGWSRTRPAASTSASSSTPSTAARHGWTTCGATSTSTSRMR